MVHLYGTDGCRTNGLGLFQGYPRGPFPVYLVDLGIGQSKKRKWARKEIGMER
jgi:hypothetical protein